MARLKSAVLLRSQPIRPRPAATVAVSALLVASFAFTWWTANYNNRAPTPIDGVWTVAAQTGTATSAPRWKRVFFERNRAFLVVFRADGQRDERHHFELAPDGNITIWETWLTKGKPIMRGRRQSDGLIELEILPEHGGGDLVLQRTHGPGI